MKDNVCMCITAQKLAGVAQRVLDEYKHRDRAPERENLSVNRIGALFTKRKRRNQTNPKISKYFEIDPRNVRCGERRKFYALRQRSRRFRVRVVTDSKNKTNYEKKKTPASNDIDDLYGFTGKEKKKTVVKPINSRLYRTRACRRARCSPKDVLLRKRHWADDVCAAKQ